MKYVLFLTALLLSSCASTKTWEDRNEKRQAEYKEEESANQEKSVTRSELMSQSKALNSKISSIDSLIKTQKDLITRYTTTDVAIAQMMIDNAKVRIRHLREEREILV